MKRIEPTSLAEVQNRVRSRIETKSPFRICGNGSRFNYERARQELSPDIADFPDELSLRKLNGVRFFDPDDLVVGVEAGMSICRLQEMLAEKNMVLPINAWFADSCIASVAACNDFGPNRLDMGGLRDYIIGIEYINGQGHIVQAGGKVVKNVSGYDLSRMMLGSQGGLGVITAVNFKVIPRPIEPHGMYGVFTNQDWSAQVKKMRELRLPLDWIQAVGTSADGWILGLGYSGNFQNRKRIEREVRQIFDDTLRVLPDGESFPGWGFIPGEKRFSGFLSQLRKVWKMPESHFHVFATLSTAEVLCFPFENFLKAGMSAAENFKPERPLRMLVHPIGGDIHFLHESTSRTEQLALLEKIKTALLQLAADVPADSKLRWVSGVPESSLQDLEKFGVANGHILTQRLKRHLDPSSVFFAPYYDFEG